MVLGSLVLVAASGCYSSKSKDADFTATAASRTSQDASSELYLDGGKTIEQTSTVEGGAATAGEHPSTDLVISGDATPPAGPSVGTDAGPESTTDLTALGDADGLGADADSGGELDTSHYSETTTEPNDTTSANVSLDADNDSGASTDAGGDAHSAHELDAAQSDANASQSSEDLDASSDLNSVYDAGWERSSDHSASDTEDTGGAISCEDACNCADGFAGSGCKQPLFRDVTAGKMHTCGLIFDGSVRCWGNDQSGQVSQAPTTNNFVALQSGGMYSCGIRSDGTVFCWGSPSSILGAPLDPVDSLVTGWDAACARMREGGHQCWGNEARYADMPTEPVQALAIGWEQACAILLDGTLTCWGANDSGQAEPPTGTGFAVLSLASWHSCAQRLDGKVECWGNPDIEPSVPVKAIGSRGLTTCVIRNDDSVTCWGAGGARDAPINIAASKLAVGDGHACALLTDGSITCWGDNSQGAAAVPVLSVGHVHE